MSGPEWCPGCHPELPFTSHKRGIDETWRSEFQTAAKDLSVHRARSFPALSVTNPLQAVILSAAKDLSQLSASRRVREKSPLPIGLMPIHFFLYRRRLLSGRNAPQLPIQNKRPQHIHTHA